MELRGIEPLTPALQRCEPDSPLTSETRIPRSGSYTVRRSPMFPARSPGNGHARGTQGHTRLEHVVVANSPVFQLLFSAR